MQLGGGIMSGAKEREDQRERRIECKVWDFKGHKIQSVHWNGQYVFPARHMGRVIEQGDDGKRFVRNVTEEGTEGVDFIRVKGKEAAEISLMLSRGADCAPGKSIGESGTGLVLLTESGLHLGLLKTRKPIGEALRLWLAREVLPALRQSGSYTIEGVQLSDVLIKIQRLESTNEALAEKIVALEKRNKEDIGAVDPEWARVHVHEQINMIARLRRASDQEKTLRGNRQKRDKEKTYRGHHRAVTNELRNLVCHNGRGSAWRNYPRDPQLIRILQNAIASKMKEASNSVSSEIRHRAEEQARAEAETKLKQLGLFDRLKGEWGLS
jgi:prophage antirepressor-like protein